jgi:hypothetical protein
MPGTVPHVELNLSAQRQAWWFRRHGADERHDPAFCRIRGARQPSPGTWKNRRLHETPAAEVFADDMAKPEERSPAAISSRIPGPKSAAVFLFAMAPTSTRLRGAQKISCRSIRSNSNCPCRSVLLGPLPCGRTINFLSDVGIQTPQKGYHAYRAAKSGGCHDESLLGFGPRSGVNAVAPGIRTSSPKRVPMTAALVGAGTAGAVGSRDMRPPWLLWEHEYLTGSFFAWTRVVSGSSPIEKAPAPDARRRYPEEQI